jgi:acyl-[acyl-carrier-protein]-phospholipid O-acyltransferase/long-chain-fatty-acid--[acyl-carrier-protein] ligase
MAKPPTPSRSLVSLLAAQAQVTFNNSAANMVLFALVQFRGVLPDTHTDTVKGVLSGLLVAPLVVFAPPAGWVNDRFPKSRVLNFALAGQVIAMALLAAAVWLHLLWAAVACLFLLALQTTVFAPAKRAILIELVAPQKLSRAVGLMEMLSVTAILLGGFGGARVFDFWAEGSGDPWRGALWPVVILTGLSALAWVVFQLVGTTPAQSNEPFRLGLFVRHGSQLLELWRSRPLLRATFGIMFFYGMGTYLYLLLLQIGADAYQGGVGSATATSTMLLAVGAGAMLGNLAAGQLSRRGVELGLVPLGGILLVGAATALGLSTHYSGATFHVWLALAGFSSGLFIVPLYAFIQQNAGNHRRGRVLAGVGMLDSLAGVAGSGLFVLAASDRMLNLTPAAQFLLIAGLALGLLVYSLRHVSHNAVHLALRALSALFYRVRVKSVENLPSTGGALVICNHVSYIDALILQVAIPRRTRFMAFSGSRQSWWLRLASRATGVRVVSTRQARAAAKQTVEKLKAGELVCVFPEAHISRSGVVMEIRKEFEVIAHAAGVPVVPVFLDRLWGSMFSFSGQKYFWKQKQHRLPCPVSVTIGSSLPGDRVDISMVRKALLDLGEAAFSERPELLGHLGRECVRSLARRPWEVQVVDCTGERSVIKAGKLLAVAAALSRRLAANIPDRRVGIVLPPSAGCCVANLAVLLAGKIPVNLNFTSGRAAIEASLRLGEVNTVLTAEAVQKKIGNFPWPEKTLDLRGEILACGKLTILKWFAATWLLPGKLLATLLGLPKLGGHEEAGLLFTSGTVGEPKGVPLSHRNLLGNCAQISATGILPKEETLLACLPIFHSFGFTATLWYPILRGCRIVTTPSPLDTRRIAEVIEAERVTVLVGAPTFLRPLLKKAERHELRSLRFAVSGAEKMPVELHDAFRERLGVELLQGYGLTETTPVTNVNLPEPPKKNRTADYQRGHRLGSVGRLLPGMTARISDPDTGAELPLTSTGIVWFRGPNVFSGYLKDEQKTRAALQDGWFITGDFGHFDDEGFLYIEGRLSRFSKIGGEMVPHGTVEQKINEVYGIEQTDSPLIIVVGVPDASKGEALVLLTSIDINGDMLREKLFSAGLPNLWIPKIIRRVEMIPLLGSGKTDYKGCRQLAVEAAK